MVWCVRGIRSSPALTSCRPAEVAATAYRKRLGTVTSGWRKGDRPDRDRQRWMPVLQHSKRAGERRLGSEREGECERGPGMRVQTSSRGTGNATAENNQSGNATESLLGRDWLDWTGGDEVSCLLLGRVEAYCVASWVSECLIKQGRDLRAPKRSTLSTLSSSQQPAACQQKQRTGPGLRDANRREGGTTGGQAALKGQLSIYPPGFISRTWLGRQKRAVRVPPFLDACWRFLFDG